MANHLGFLHDLILNSNNLFVQIMKLIYPDISKNKQKPIAARDQKAVLITEVVWNLTCRMFENLIVITVKP